MSRSRNVTPPPRELARRCPLCVRAARAAAKRKNRANHNINFAGVARVLFQDGADQVQGLVLDFAIINII